MASAATVSKNPHLELVNFDTDGNIVVSKDENVSHKLLARRAIEAHLERKEMQLDNYWDMD